MGSGERTNERERAILRDRARALATVPSAPRRDGDHVEALHFMLGAGTYAMERGHIREVVPLDRITPLPCVPAFVRGIMNVRGRTVSVLDLGKILGLPDAGGSPAPSVIVLQLPEIEFGVLADEVLGLAAIPLTSLQPSLPTLTDSKAEYLKGVTAHGLVLLDAGKLLQDRNLVIDEAVGSTG